MKNLLNYQTSEYDCGPVSLLNGIRYLFEREEIVPRHVCICCGKIFNGEGFRCTKCEIIERDKRLNQRARARKYYRSMMPHKS